MLKMRMSKKAKVLTFCFFLLCLLAAGLYVVGIALTESLYTKKGTLDYYLTIHSETIKKFPQIKKVGDEQYYSGNADGLKPSATGILYHSEERRETLIEYLVAYLLSRGFEKSENLSSKTRFRYTSKDSTFDLLIDSDPNGDQFVVGTEYHLNND